MFHQASTATYSIGIVYVLISFVREWNIFLIHITGVKSEFCGKLHMFLAKLTDIHHRMLGLTVMYVPEEGLDTPVEIASKDKELVKRLEAVVVYWTRQIRTVLQDQEQNVGQELLCLIDEYEFWIYRCNYQFVKSSNV